MLNEMVKNASWTFLINVCRLSRDETEDDDWKEVRESGAQWWSRSKTNSKRSLYKCRCPFENLMALQTVEAQLKVAVETN